MIKFKSINQSLIKKIVSPKEDPENSLFLLEDYCPQRIYVEYISKTHRQPPTESQYAGLYGESHVLGLSADGNQYSEVPLTKRGQVPVKYQRINEQIKNIQMEFLKNGVAILPNINTQIPLAYFCKDIEIEIRGTLDIFPTNIISEGESKKAIIDLKFTGGMDFQWGNLNFVDFLQADLYTDMVLEIMNNKEHMQYCRERFPTFDYSYVFNSDIVSEIQKNGITFFYFIFGYEAETSAPPLVQQKKIIERIRTKQKVYDMKRRLFYAVEQLRQDELMGWDYNPSENACNKCPLKLSGECSNYPNITKA